MKALVTGATGFVGAAVARALVAEGHAVRVLARRESPAKNLEGLAVERVEGDLRDAPSLRRALEGCEVLFHVAAHYALWAKDPRTLYETNVGGTVALMEAALDVKIARVVYTSSVAVLKSPAPGSIPSDERSEPASVDEVIGDYKKSKYLAERAVRELAERRGLPVVTVLPSTPIGPGDVKPTPTGAIVLDFLTGRMTAYVDTGLNIVDVDDCALGHLLAWRKGRVGERYILGNENLSLREILGLLGATTGLAPPRVRMPYAVAHAYALCGELLARFTGRPPRAPLDAVRMSKKRMFFNPGKALLELGLPQTPARESLRRAALWFCENGYVRGPAASGIAARLRASAPVSARSPAPALAGS
jgi:dihydroflavonol-4-reductase